MLPVSKSVETASKLPMPLLLLPFLGGSMPAGLRWFAQYLPFTPITETLRGLLMGRPLGDNGWLALGWCAAIVLGGYLWSKRLFNRGSARRPVPEVPATGRTGIATRFRYLGGYVVPLH